MSEFRAAYRYALALINVAEEMKQLDGISNDLEALERLTKESREFRLFLKSPVVNKLKKKTVIIEILQYKINELTMKFVLLLASKDREGLLPEIIQQFYKLRDQRLGILNVTARTAVAFQPEQERQLVRQLERATKKKIQMKYIVETSLKGGFAIQYDDTIWDASVRHQLEILRGKFAEGTA